MVTPIDLAPGERNIVTLLASMRPILHPITFVFLTFAHGTPIPPEIQPMMTFQEAEGVTVIAPQSTSQELGLDGTFPCRMVTLSVNSSLNAIGFLATITTTLRDECQMPVNPVSGFHHDHLFLSAERVDETIRVLEQLSREAREGIADGTVAGVD